MLIPAITLSDNKHVQVDKNIDVHVLNLPDCDKLYAINLSVELWAKTSTTSGINVTRNDTSINTGP